MKKVFYIRDVETGSYFCLHASDEFFTPKPERALEFNIKKTARNHLEYPDFANLFKGKILEICEFYKEAE
jgi:hypothetical protein